MKRAFVLLLALALTARLLCGCGSMPAPPEEEGKLSIVTTVFPAYDWVKNILGEEAESVTLSLLTDKGVDLHSYQPGVDDMIRISRCDLFIYVGGSSDDWVADALREAVNPDQIAVNLLELLGDAVREEEEVEGMQPVRGEDEDEVEYDEHVWLSLRNAGIAVAALAEMLGGLDGANRERYAANAAAYIRELEALDERYRESLADAAHHTLLVADRFPLRYLAEDYGLDYYAAFAGCAAETEASFETVRFLSEKLRQLRLPAVLTIEGGDGRLARTVAEAAGEPDLPILCVDSMQSVTAAELKAGASYLSVMEQNLAVLRAALG